MDSLFCAGANILVIIIRENKSLQLAHEGSYIIYIQYSSRPSLQKMQVMVRASRNFAFNSRVGLVRYERILLASDN